MEQNKKDDLDAVREVVKALESFNEEEQYRIIRWSCEKLGIDTPTLSNGQVAFKERPPFAQDTDNVPSVTATDSSRRTITNIKTFVAEKNPKSDNHFAAVVAYYHQFEAPFEMRKDSITKSDLVEATRLADYSRLKRPDQTLVNAMNAGLLDSAGSRGHYALNSVGENLVAMTLPDVTSNGTPTRTRKPKKSTTKPAKKAIKKSSKK